MYNKGKRVIQLDVRPFVRGNPLETSAILLQFKSKLTREICNNLKEVCQFYFTLSNCVQFLCVNKGLLHSCAFQTLSFFFFFLFTRCLSHFGEKCSNNCLLAVATLLGSTDSCILSNKPLKREMSHYLNACWGLSRILNATSFPQHLICCLQINA